nr:uncharacterized protein LOC124814302 [Hydra vulgaris]
MKNYKVYEEKEQLSNKSVYRETLYYIKDKYKDEDIIEEMELDQQMQSPDEIVFDINEMTEIGFNKEFKNAKTFHDVFNNFLLGFNFAMLCGKSVEEGMVKVIKRYYTSPVYFIKPLEGPVHLQYLKNNNLSAAFNILENESGWRIIRLCSFKVKSLSHLSDKSMMKLRNYEMGGKRVAEMTVEELKERREKDRIRKRLQRAQMTVEEKTETREKDRIRKQSKEPKQLKEVKQKSKKKKKKRSEMSLKELMEIREKDRLQRKLTAEKRKARESNETNEVKQKSKIKKSFQNKEIVYKMFANEWRGEWNRPIQLSSEHVQKNYCKKYDKGSVINDISTYSRKYKMLLDYSSLFDSGLCFYSSFLICLLIRKWQVTTIEQWNENVLDKNGRDFYSEDNILEHVLRDECEKSQWEKKLMELREKCKHMSFENLLELAQSFVYDVEFDRINIKLFAVNKNPQRIRLMHPQYKSQYKTSLTELFKVVYESKNITREERNCYRDFVNDEERQKHNEHKKSVNTLKLAIVEKKDHFHAVSIINERYVTQFHDGSFQHCSQCNEKFVNHAHNDCKGYYKKNKFTYSNTRQYKEGQKEFMNRSRNLFPFFITYDCETTNTPDDSRQTKLVQSVSSISYFCHSVVIQCIDENLALECFGRDERGKTITQWIYYYENTIDSLKRNPLKLLPSALYDAVSTLHFTHRELLYLKLDPSDPNIENKKNELRVYDLIVLADTLVRFAYNVLLPKHQHLKLSPEERILVWEKAEPLCTVCRYVVDKFAQSDILKFKIEEELEYLDHNEIRTTYNDQRIQVINFIFQKISKLELFALNLQVQNYLLKHNAEKIKTDLLNVSTLYYVVCRWWDAFKYKNPQNGLLSDYVRTNFHELIDLMKYFGSLVLNEHELRVWFENDPIELLSVKHFLIHFFKKCMEQIRVDWEYEFGMGIKDEVTFLHILSKLKHPAVQLWYECMLQPFDCEYENKVTLKELCREDQKRERLLIHCQLFLSSFEDFLVIDHDHFSGNVYGLAHDSCNKNIGRCNAHLTCPIFAHNAAFDNRIMIVEGLRKFIDLPLYESAGDSEDEPFKAFLKYTSFEDMFVIAQNTSKVRIISFGKHIQIVDTLRLLNCSLEQACSMLSQPAQKKIINSMLHYLYPIFPHISADNLSECEEFQHCFIKKTLFPYEQINDALLDIEYKSFPPIEMFAENLLMRSKSLREEIEKIRVPYESVKKLWHFLKLKTLRPLLEIYAVLDTVVLGAVMLDFDERTYQSTKFHILSHISIFGYASKFNSTLSLIQIQYPPTQEHHDMIEDCLRGGMSTNGTQRYAIDTDYFEKKMNELNINSELDGCVYFFDENGQYGGAQLKPLPFQMRYTFDIDCKNLQEVIDKYHRVNANGFSTSALVHCQISMLPEYQDKVGGYSPMIKKEIIPLQYYSPTEIASKRYLKKNGKYAIQNDKTVKLVMKLSSHETVECLDTLMWMTRHCGVLLEKIYKVLPVWRFPLAEKMVRDNIEKRKKAVESGDQVTDAYRKLLTNGHFGILARRSEKNVSHEFIVHAENAFQNMIKNLQDIRLYLLTDSGYNDSQIKKLFPKHFQNLLYRDDGYVGIEPNRYKLDIIAKKVCLDTYETVDYAYDTYFKELLFNVSNDVKTKSVLFYGESSVEFKDIFELFKSDTSFYKQALIMRSFEKMKSSNKSLRLPAAHILCLAKLNIAQFSWQLGEILRKRGGEKFLVATDTDSCCNFIVRKKEKNKVLPFRVQVDEWLFYSSFDKWLDYSNYPTDHPFFSKEFAKETDYFQNEIPPPRYISQVIAMGAKCYSVDSVNEKNEKKGKNRAKGVPNYKLRFENYIDGLSTYTAEKIFRNLNNQLDCTIDPVTQNRMRLNVDKVTINKHELRFLEKFTQKNYVFDDNLLTEIRDHYRLDPIVKANLKVLPNIEEFCSDEHLQTLLIIEKKIINDSNRYKTLVRFNKNVSIPLLYDFKTKINN